MANIKGLYRSFYLSKRSYVAGAALVLLFILSFYVPMLEEMGKVSLGLMVILILVDAAILYGNRRGIAASRKRLQRFSNGDENKIEITVVNQYGFTINARLIDEIPVQFQDRNWKRDLKMEGGTTKIIEYFLKPFERGEYAFRNIIVLAESPVGLVKRRFEFPAEEIVAVYPSYLQMRKFGLHAVTNELQEAGNKKLRKSGHSVEFEQIKDYVRGDDYRTVNWKASARKSQLMVNTYVDEKSQQIICVIDKGRSMKMPFDGLALLDYAINSSLVLSNVALHKQDKMGLLTFGKKVDTYLPPERKSLQMEAILETLYKQQTDFTDSGYEALYSYVRNKIKQRSLLVLFTNFESLYSLQRQMPYLKMMAHYHLLLLVFFENTEIKKLVHTPASNTEEIYIKTIAEKFSFEKRQMVKELNQQGILTLLTTPEQLTVNAINKYLEIKARQML